MTTSGTLKMYASTTSAASACISGTSTGLTLTDSGGGVVSAVGGAAYDTKNWDTAGITTGHGLADGKLRATRNGLWTVNAAIQVNPGGDATNATEYRWGGDVAVNGSSNPTPVSAPGTGSIAMLDIGVNPPGTLFAQPGGTVVIAFDIPLVTGDLLQLIVNAAVTGPGSKNVTFYIGLFQLRYAGAMS